MTTDRKSVIARGVALPSSKGIEIGPLDKPLISRSESSIFYADHATAEQLRAKYANDPHVNLSSIPDIDILLGENTLPDLVGDSTMDYIIASHVIEHVPDLVRFLSDTSQVLRAGGVLCLAIPDKRYTFDALRRETFIEDIRHAYFQKAKRPSLDQVIDHIKNVVILDREFAWKDYPAAVSSSRLKHNRDSIIRQTEEHKSGKYVDCHCWVFTPAGFIELIQSTCFEFNIPYKIKIFVDTPRPLLEFYVQLEKVENSAT